MAQVLKFDVGVPAFLALKFEGGKACEGRFGQQFQFTTTDDRVFWLDPDHASDVQRAVREYNIAVGEEFKITKCKTSHGGHRFVVEPAYSRREPIEEHKPAPRRRAPGPPPAGSVSWDEYERMNDAPPPAPPAAPAGPSIAPSGAAACMAASMCAAVDAIIETQAYAQRKGLGVTFSEESVRAIGLSIYIGACKGGR